MKKSLLIIPAIILIVAVVLTSVILNRRDQFDIETDDRGVVDFTTEPATESVIDATPPNWPELYEKYGNARGEDTWNSYSNSVYYFFGNIDQGAAGVAIHKDTRALLKHLCQDPLCTHGNDCVLSNLDEWSVNTTETIGDRIYFLYQEMGDGSRLVSTDLSLNDVRIEWEREDGWIDNMQADGDRLYFMENIYDENTGDHLRNTVFWYSTSDQTSGYVKETMDIRSYLIYDGVLYAQIGLTRLVRCDVDNPIPETILEVEAGKNIGMEYVDNTDLVFSVITGYTFSESRRLNLDTLQVTEYLDAFPQEYSYLIGSTWGDSSFLCIDHSGEAYKDDPYYDFYADSEIAEVSYKRSLTAGRIYRLNDRGELVELAQLTTNGVPDLISSIRGYDGRYLYVWYGTYQSFHNELNPDSDKKKPECTHLAMIDTQTGQVYKLTETSGE